MVAPLLGKGRARAEFQLAIQVERSSTYPVGQELSKYQNQRNELGCHQRREGKGREGRKRKQARRLIKTNSNGGESQVGVITGESSAALLQGGSDQLCKWG